MRILQWTLAPCIILAVVLLSFISFFLPGRLKTGLMGLAVLFITFLATNSRSEPPYPTCYKMPPPETLRPPVSSTPQWENYRKSYLDLIDYLAGDKLDTMGLDERMRKVKSADAGLDELAREGYLSNVVLEYIRLGINGCYESTTRKLEDENNVQTDTASPEARRMLAFQQAVGNQVSIRKQVRIDPISAQNMLWEVRDHIADPVEPFVSYEDFVSYRILMQDLILLTTDRY